MSRCYSDDNSVNVTVLHKGMLLWQFPAISSRHSGWTMWSRCVPLRAPPNNDWLENIRSYVDELVPPSSSSVSFQVMWGLDDCKNRWSSIVNICHADTFHGVPIVFLLKTGKFLGNVLFGGKINLAICHTLFRWKTSGLHLRSLDHGNPPKLWCYRCVFYTP